MASGSGERRGLDPRAVSSAGLLSAPFVLCLVALALFNPPTPLEQRHTDPLLEPYVAAAPWLTLAISVAVVTAWVKRFPPSRRELLTGLGWWTAGVGVALLAVVVLRAVAGNALPAFIPPEESAKPGITLGLTAGVLEEMLFRLVALPAAYLGLLRYGARDVVASIVAVVATSLLFALAHEIGSPPFDASLFVTRTLLPGLLMSAAFRWVAPCIVIGGHCGAHLMIPFAFS